MSSHKSQNSQSSKTSPIKSPIKVDIDSLKPNDIDPTEDFEIQMEESFQLIKKSEIRSPSDNKKK